jgi:hypothetical protein
MPVRQVIFVLAVSAMLLAVVVELVRRRRLREEYAWLWLLAAVAAPIVVVGYPLLRKLAPLMGVDEPVSVLWLAGLVFLVVVNIHYSTKISQLTEQTKNLAQALALATAQLPHTPDRHASLVDGHAREAETGVPRLGPDVNQ